MFLAIAGRPDEAIEKLERAMRLSPRDRFRWEFLSGTAMAHFAARRYEEAVDKSRHSLHHRPDWLLSQGILAASYAQLERMDDARKAREEMSRMHPEFTLTALRALLAAGDPDVAERLLGGLREAGLPE